MYPGEDTLRLEKGKISAEGIPQISFGGNIYKGNKTRLKLHFETGDIHTKMILHTLEQTTGKKISDPGGTVFGSLYNYFFTIFHLLTAGFYVLLWSNILALNG